MAREKKGYNLNDLASLVEQAMEQGDKSGFLSNGVIDTEFKTLLKGGVEFNSEVPEYEQDQIVTKIALFEYKKITRPITATKLIRECTKYESKYLSLPKSGYRLLTGISISKNLNIPRISVDETTLIFNPKKIKGYMSHSKLFNKNKSALNIELPYNYMQLSAFVNARCPHKAAEQCLDSIDFIRAIWNLYLNRSKTWRYSSMLANPINDVRLSPFHTIHKDNGALAVDSFWYEPEYKRSEQLFDNEIIFKKVLTFTKKIRLKLSKNPYGADIETSLIRYVRALDSKDMSNAFIKLWGLLEYLTHSVSMPSKVAIKRAAFMYKEGVKSRLMLNNIAERRNRYVHAGSETSDIESLLFQLKRHVESLLIFHIGNSFKFSKLEEAAEFMDQPPCSMLLKAQVKKMQDAIKFVGG